MKKLVSIGLLGISFSAFASELENVGQVPRSEGFDLAQQLAETQEALAAAQRLLIVNARQQCIEANKKELEALQNTQGLIQQAEFFRDVMPAAVGQLAGLAKVPFGFAAGLLIPYHSTSHTDTELKIFTVGGLAAACGLEKFSEYFDRKPRFTAAALAQRDKQATLMAAVVCAGTAGLVAGKYILPKLIAKS
ncbi:MAG: hypothetical protein EBU90_13855 [Proteobacteria bacterium]|nr:hypothetical protein [Pseudomonadota bacterium]NBP15470.1 hypothetical protein [bacterium]